MNKVKQEFGIEAVILKTRQFKQGGFFGLFGKVKVEITASIDEHLIPKRSNASRDTVGMNYIPAQTQPDEGNNTYQSYSTNTQLPENEVQSLLNMMKTVSERIENIATPAMSPNGGQEVPTYDLSNILKNTDTIDPVKSVEPIQIAKPLQLPEVKPLQKWSDFLIKRGVTPTLANSIITDIENSTDACTLATDEYIRQSLEIKVRELCSRTAEIQPKRGKPVVVAFIGTAGIGKTTTIGKLATCFRILDSRNIALVTVDTFRVAAAEQLKAFGKVIGVPVDTALNPTNLRDIIHSHSDKELIFIDTAGRNPYNKSHMAELEDLLDKAQPDLTILVIGANVHSSDQENIYDGFKGLTTHLLFTKLDETINCGAILNIITSTKLPVTYTTDGQNVPDDIKIATPDNLTKYILGT